MKRKNILLTGCTGFLGSYLFRELLLDRRNHVIVLVRAENQKKAFIRIQCIIKNMFRNDQHIYKRLSILRGDVCATRIGLSLAKYKYLENNIDEIFHCAANTDFRMGLNEARYTNVNGTKNIINLLKVLKRKSVFHYVSTAFISGDFKGAFSETEFNVGQNFNNAYEKSKFEAELIVRQLIPKFNVFIYRPSIVVGEFLSGKTTNFKMFYQPLRFFYNEIFKTAPWSASALYNFIPVDIAARWIVQIGMKTKTPSTYHIVNKENMKLGDIMMLSSKFLNFKPPKPVSERYFNKVEKSAVAKKIIAPFVPYLNFKSIFLRNTTELQLKKISVQIEKIDKNFVLRLLKYCLNVNFLKKQ